MQPSITSSVPTGRSCVRNAGHPSLHSSRWRRRIAGAVAFATLVTILSTSPTRANDIPGTSGAQHFVLGAVLAKKTADPGNKLDDEQSLGTRPVGKQIYKTLAEVEQADDVAPGAKVDVALVTLGDEGTKSTVILKGLTVYSLGTLRKSGGQSSENESATGNGTFPVRVVGFVVSESQLETLRLADAQGIIRLRLSKTEQAGGIFSQVLHNFTTNLFQPLLLFFFMGFVIPLLKVPFEFPKALYQSLTIYLLVAIGWHGGELMAQQSPAELAIAGGLVAVGFVTNGLIGISATKILHWFTPMRRIDTVTVGAYYGSDSAGTFVTCLGILAALNILHDSYMPVMLAVMEIPGCLVGLFLVSRLRRQGMDVMGNMPDEPGYATEVANAEVSTDQQSPESHNGEAEAGKRKMAHNSVGAAANPLADEPARSGFNWKILHEVFLNPGLFLLFGGIIVGFISGLQALEDPHVVEGPNHLFVFIFKGALCLFLLEMGMTACKRLRDLKTAGLGFIIFGVLGPVVFAVFGMLVLHLYSMALGHQFYLGTYALFAVLCAAASYIAVPAVQRLAIPEASPTLPLAASLGLTFTWNVTLGIPIYIEIAKGIIAALPVG